MADYFLPLTEHDYREIEAALGPERAALSVMVSRAEWERIAFETLLRFAQPRRASHKEG